MKKEQPSALLGCLGGVILRPAAEWLTVTLVTWVGSSLATSPSQKKAEGNPRPGMMTGSRGGSSEGEYHMVIGGEDFWHHNAGFMNYAHRAPTTQ